ncbi:hypothetical protein C823_004328 [Eubacterium plexicaudatum ASF492]|uniref:Uncharacterized protein n=1 Tax=Eubacterium plexicaudatum ASF492 TaxID=1235802 RepID=N2ABI7_9FIRM|nr:hypothetical protein C823_004328 [Eubacterium plexicaudatum ASF492]
MQQYQFEKIYAQMEQEFGKIEKGTEDYHTLMIYPIESNLLKTYRKFPSSNSRRLLEAIGLVLYNIRSRYTGETYAVESFRNEDNARLEHAILMAFDPFTNEELRSLMTMDPDIDLTDKETLREIYAEPVICLLRIKESVDSWIKRMGSNGYFEFSESYMGPEISGDELVFAWTDTRDDEDV